MDAALRLVSCDSNCYWYPWLGKYDADGVWTLEGTTGGNMAAMAGGTDASSIDHE